MKRLLVFALLVATPLPGGARQARPPDQRADDPDYRRPSAAPAAFKLDYFAGTWTFDWDVPDSVFGEGGEITGTETFTCSPDGSSCDSALQATGPAGAFTQTTHMTFDASTRSVTRTEKDSRGFEIRYAGVVSNDLGFPQITYSGAAFRYKDKPVQLKTAASMTAPGAYRVRFQISVDGGPFENFGNPWWRKSAP